LSFEVEQTRKTNLVELDQVSLGQGGIVSPDRAEAEQPEGVEATPLVGLWQLQGSKAPAKTKRFINIFKKVNLYKKRLQKTT